MCVCGCKRGVPAVDRIRRKAKSKRKGKKPSPDPHHVVCIMSSCCCWFVASFNVKDPPPAACPLHRGQRAAGEPIRAFLLYNVRSSSCSENLKNPKEARRVHLLSPAVFGWVAAAAMERQTKGKADFPLPLYPSIHPITPHPTQSRTQPPSRSIISRLDWIGLGDEGGGGGGLVLPVGRELARGAVVAGEAVDAGLDEDEAELGVLVLAVALQVLCWGGGGRWDKMDGWDGWMMVSKHHHKAPAESRSMP